MPTNLKLTKAAFVRVDGYFYTLDSSNDTLFKKVDSGENAFSYPLNQDLANECLAIQYDGNYFYTLECITSGNGQILIKKWKIIDYILTLQRTYNLLGTASQKYNSSAFAIESFTRLLTSVAVTGASILTVSETSRFNVGDVIVLGPSTFSGDIGKTEEVTVLSIINSTQIQLSSTIVNSYNPNDKVTWGSRCWVFNKFQPNDIDPVNGSGQLYSFNLSPVSPTVTPRKAGTQFRNVLAATYILDSNYPAGAREFLAYMNQTNLLFIETDINSSNFLNTMESAAQNNQEVLGAVIPVYAIAYEGNNLFRLQRKATYVTGTTATTEDWGTQYNYQLSTMRRLPQSVALSATNGVIAADGVSTTSISATVKDQFDVPVGSKTVSFTDSDTGTGSGNCSPSSSVTNGNGIASTTYTAGNTAKTVTITADVT